MVWEVCNCLLETGSDVIASCSCSSEGQVGDALQCILAQVAGLSGRLQLLRHGGMEALAQRYLLQKYGKGYHSVCVCVCVCVWWVHILFTQPILSP